MGNFKMREIDIGGTSVISSCNPGIGDVNNDKKDEIAIPVTQGENDTIRLVNGEGETIWITKVKFLRSYYKGTLLSHRHIFTEIYDIDGDGKQEVICGNGPLYILDGETGKIKNVIDLGGSIELWCLANIMGKEYPSNIVLTLGKKNDDGGHIIALSMDMKILWDAKTKGRSFGDIISSGDINIDGFDEIGVSTADTNEFFLFDRMGKILWSKNIPEEIGPDSHVDDFVIEKIHPQIPGKQLFSATGGCLFDKDGSLLWNLNDILEHGQRVFAVDNQNNRQIKDLVVTDSFQRKMYRVSGEGKIIWKYDDFSSFKDDKGEEVMRISTSASDLINWSGKGEKEIVQAELIDSGLPTTVSKRGHVKLYLTLLNSEGKTITKLPYEDIITDQPFAGAMCAKAARVTGGENDDIVVITHNSGKVLIFSNILS